MSKFLTLGFASYRDDTSCVLQLVVATNYFCKNLLRQSDEFAGTKPVRYNSHHQSQFDASSGSKAAWYRPFVCHIAKECVNSVDAVGIRHFHDEFTPVFEF